MRELCKYARFLPYFSYVLMHVFVAAFSELMSLGAQFEPSEYLEPQLLSATSPLASHELLPTPGQEAAKGMNCVYVYDCYLSRSAKN